MKLFRCLFPGCGNLLPASGYCEKHKAQHEKEKAKPFQTSTRSNESLYHTSQWKQMRAELIKRSPFCFVCGSRENLQAHHLTPPRGNPAIFFNPDNLAVVCASCHRLITLQEIKDRRNGRNP